MRRNLPGNPGQILKAGVAPPADLQAKQDECQHLQCNDDGQSSEQQWRSKHGGREFKANPECNDEGKRNHCQV